MGAGVLLKVDSLYKNFGGIQAVMDLSFDLAEGELLGIIGPNGSGKTTAVNLITGFVKPSRAPSSTGAGPSAAWRPIRWCGWASPAPSRW